MKIHFLTGVMKAPQSAQDLQDWNCSCLLARAKSVNEFPWEYSFGEAAELRTWLQAIVF
jgi:hypothetical protein